MINSGYSHKNESAVYDRIRDTEDMDRVDAALTKYVMNPDYSYEVDIVMDDAIKEYGNTSALTLYRGLNFDTKEDYDKFMKSIKGGVLKTKSLSSWSPNKSEAETFAVTKPSYMEFMTKEKMAMISAQRKSGERITGYRGIILKTKISKGKGVDLRRFKNQAESEVLLPNGNYKVTYEEILSYKDQFSNQDPSDRILSLTKQGKETDKILEYIRRNYKPTQLSNEARHKICLLTVTFSKLGKYYVKVQEPSQWDKNRKIDTGMVVPDKDFMEYYLSSDINKMASTMKPLFKKMIKEVFSKWTPGTEISWFLNHGYWARFCDADTDLTKAERSTLKKEYDKQDQIVRDINKIRDPNAQRQAIDAEMERIKKIIGSI